MHLIPSNGTGNFKQSVYQAKRGNVFYEAEAEAVLLDEAAQSFLDLCNWLKRTLP